ncbi:hypothetical protein ACIG5E_34895 [Kitasatospora sp. NPDC053057]|uniref:hypothetical protein n=1 Tax=Kitasatospora sp. NPDC053057 TaxID=3364062 RepID=UPI0037C50932
MRHQWAGLSAEVRDLIAGRCGTVTGVTVKRHRAVATRYDKLAVRYYATVLVAAINERQ